MTATTFRVDVQARRRARLLREMERTGIGQSELAKLTGVSRPNITAMLAGRREISAEMEVRLVSALVSGARPSQSLAAHRDAVVSLVGRYGFHSPRVFGSVARGADRHGSDLDLMVLPGAGVQGAGARAQAMESLRDDLERLLEVRVDVVLGDQGVPSKVLAEAVPL